MKFRLLTLFLILLLIYFNSFNGPFIYDDYSLVVNNQLVRSFKNIPVLFREISQPTLMGYSFRPVQIVTYMLDYKIWKLDFLGYHLTNFTLHFLNVLLVYFISFILLRNKNIAFLIALFFSIHPLNTQAVTYISGRADLLACFFVLLSLLSYIYYVQKNRKFYIPISILFFILGILSKEIAIMALLLCFTYSVIFQRQIPKVIGFYFLCLLVYILSRIQTLANIVSPIPFKERLLTVPLIFLKYLKLVFIPINLRMSYAIDFVSSVFSLRFLIPFLFSMTLLCLFFYLLKKDREIKFGLAWYLINFIFICNAVLPLNAPFAEHWLYLGLPGFLLFFIPMLYKIFKKSNRIFITSVVGISFFFYSILTIKRNQEWLDPVSFYKKELKFTPTNYKAHFNLGILYFNNQELQKAEQAFKEALRIEPELYQALFGLGLIYEEKADIKNALKYYKMALEINPDFEQAKIRLESFK